VKKDLIINYINIDKDAKIKKIDLIEIDISKGEISFLQKERSKNQLIPTKKPIAEIDQIKKEKKKRLQFSSGGGGYNPPPPPAEPEYIDPLPEVSNDDAYIRMNGWCVNGSCVGGNSERVLRPNHPSFLGGGEVIVNGRLAYYTEIGGEKIIYNNTLNRWELLAMWYGNGDPNNPLLGIGTGSNIPYPFYATWTTYIDPVFNASIQSIEKVAVGTTKAPDPGPPCA
jgi:hypothetical protein